MGKRRVAEKKVRATQHGQRAWNHQITLWDIHTAARATTTKNNGFFLLYGALSIAERFIFSPQSTICARDAVVHCNCWCDDVIFILWQTFAFGAFHCSGPFVNFYYFHAKRKLLWVERWKWEWKPSVRAQISFGNLLCRSSHSACSAVTWLETWRPARREEASIEKLNHWFKSKSPTSPTTTLNWRRRGQRRAAHSNFYFKTRNWTAAEASGETKLRMIKHPNSSAWMSFGRKMSSEQKQKREK